MTAGQLSDHYSQCMKLSAENKINVKNAFHLNLIDYMTEMMRKKNSDLDNFSAASGALDASAKIYAYRVDSVHSDTLKLAGGVGKEAADAAGESKLSPILCQGLLDIFRFRHFYFTAFSGTSYHQSFGNIE